MLGGSLGLFEGEVGDCVCRDRNRFNLWFDYCIFCMRTYVLKVD